MAKTESNIFEKAWAHKKKTFVWLAALAVVAFLIYEIGRAFFDRNKESWENNLAVTTTEIVVGAKNKVKEAEAKKDYACMSTRLDGSLDDPEACALAKKELQVAVAHYEDIQKNKDKMLSQAGTVKVYYEGTAASAQQKPLPFYIFASIAAIVAMLMVYGFTLLGKKKQKTTI